ncbi:MAG: octaprenyl diphosphate synthase [Methylococcales bacterium]|jgi:octaprenyl-diphosphate synthase|nr:octaprenyl diphosphate synthase [Methylococcales bacterium]MBT7445967.1 octaprenyl diphosphate synthase [Methylococcales bacterium]
MEIQEIKQLVANDMAAVNNVIETQLHTDVELIDQLSHYIINSGGKRLRPMIVLLSANALGYQGKQHFDLAAIIEFIHTATLLHDDVVDASDLRRGKTTANHIWGNEASVLVGDFLYSRAFEMMVHIGKMSIMDILASTTNTIAEGEVLQLLNRNNPKTTEQQYLEVIRRKTAKLFEAGAELGAICADNDKQRTSLALYGLNLGNAFQLVDDALDYSSDADEIGKNIGDDLAEGKPTLPLIHVMKTGNAAQVQLIEEAIENGGLDKINDVKQAIEETGAIQYTIEQARFYAQEAISTLSSIADSDHKAALAGIAEFSVERTY